MAEEKKKEKKSSDKPKPKSGGPPAAGGGPPGMESGPGGPAMGMPPVGGAAMGAMPSMGAPPPMPGTGIDPYAALMGQVSSSPMSMPMGGTPGDQMGGGMGGGMGLEALAGPLGGNVPGGHPNDDVTAALMSSANPARAGADLGEHALDPNDMQGQMSVQQLLTLLTMLQGGVPNSGLNPPGQPGSTVAGLQPPMIS